MQRMADLVLCLALCLALCLGLLLPSHTLWADSGPAEENPTALRLAKLLDLEAMTLPPLRAMLPTVPSQGLVDLLVQREENLWRDLEGDFARSLGRRLDEQQMVELITFFESPLGQSWIQAQGVLLQQAVASDPTRDVPPVSSKKKAPLRRLAKTLDLEEADANLFGQFFSRSQIQGLVTFFDSPVGKHWSSIQTEVQQELTSGFNSGSALRRIAVLGCSLGALAPNLEAQAKAAGVDSSELTARGEELLGPVIDRVTLVCDCIIGELLATVGPQALDPTQAGSPEVAAVIQDIGNSGVCLSPEMRAAASTNPHQKAVELMKGVGASMMAWLTDQFEGSGPDDLPPTGDAGWTMVPQDGADPAFFARVSVDDLEKILAPKYLKKLPRTDSWGNAFEYAVNPNLLEAQVLGIRSAGPDGVFEEQGYNILGFGGTLHPPAAEDKAPDDDILWADGYFVARPSE